MRKFSRLVMRGGTRGRARRSRCFKDGKEGGSAATRILAGTCMQCLPAARKVPTSLVNWGSQVGTGGLLGTGREGRHGLSMHRCTSVSKLVTSGYLEKAAGSGQR